VADLAAFGLQAPAGLGPQEVEIWPENLETVEAFFACQTQWLFDFEGNRQGIRYEALHAALSMMGAPDVAEIFAGVRIMERAALAAFDKLARQRNR